MRHSPDWQAQMILHDSLYTDLTTQVASLFSERVQSIANRQKKKKTLRPGF